MTADASIARAKIKACILDMVMRELFQVFLILCSLIMKEFVSKTESYSRSRTSLYTRILFYYKKPLNQIVDLDYTKLYFKIVFGTEYLRMPELRAYRQ